LIGGSRANRNINREQTAMNDMGASSAQRATNRLHELDNIVVARLDVRREARAFDQACHEHADVRAARGRHGCQLRRHPRSRLLIKQKYGLSAAAFILQHGETYTCSIGHGRF
jgi:hypothetical protein